MTTQHIQLRRGTAADLPDGGTIEGEPRFTTDTGQLYVDDGTANVLIGGTGASAVNVLDAKGDIPYASAANTLAALNIGTAGQVLTTNSAADAPEWQEKVSNTAYAASWDTVTTIAPSKNAVYDKIQTLMALTGSNLAIGSDADGDMYYRASSVLARLAKGAADLKLFMNAGATAPEWSAGMKIGALTRNMTAASGNVSYTGVGFKPSHIIFISVLQEKGLSICFTDGTKNYGVSTYEQSGVTYNYPSSACSTVLTEAADKSQYAYVSSLDTDGFTLSWVKQGSPTNATAYVYYMAFR